ncbi:MAG TPA: PQQ-dependent sugar dehydrogenase, partial [Polyangiaceae bacterium]|nr:PQQ-dependent sugar dehydrogenase [Polyangiaceae bacterium]
MLLVACGRDFTELHGGGQGPPVAAVEEPPDAGVADAGEAVLTDAGLPDAALPPVVPFVLPEGITGLPAKLELAADWRLVEAFPGVSFDDPVALIAAPRTNQLIVSEREGKVYAFENRPDVTEKRLVLDLSGQNQGENDSGLLGIVCHPEFAAPGSSNAQYLYAHYAFREAPIVGRTPPVSTPTRSRLSRFTVDLQTLVADPASELVLIDQEDQSIWHQGGALMFHPGDGFLYLTVGDEGGSRCQYANCQRIDKDLFSGVLRIDVDQKGGNVSHPIPRQPATGTTQGYFIPNDNPFVGQTGVLEEFYALGLRNTYKMTHDPVDDLVWMGEVGQESREEIDILAPGANYQWNVFEGTQRGYGALPETPLGVWTDPLLDFDRRQMLTIIGGYVYRGQRLPALAGKYVFADWSRGNIFALPYQRHGNQLELGELEYLMTAEFRNRENGITSFGVDETGELYVLALGADSRIQRLEFGGTQLNAPRTLSAVGVFRDRAALAPVESLVPYTVQSPLWSDGAQKQRWLAVPAGGQVDFAPLGPWQFPEGTVFVKHFAKALDERQPDVLTRLETRLLVAGAEQTFYGLTYKWN